MRQQCSADASGPPSSCEPGAPRSQALVLELSRLSRRQAQRAESVRSARIALAQRRLVATPPDGPRRVRAKIVNSRSWGLRRSLNHLRILTREEVIASWDDRKILPGDEWDHQIHARL